MDFHKLFKYIASAIFFAVIVYALFGAKDDGPAVQPVPNQPQTKFNL
jgi:hypothetical protein